MFDHHKGVLGIIGGCEIETKVTTVRYSFPFKQFKLLPRVLPTSEPPTNNDFSALLIKKGSVAELIPRGVDFNQARVYAPRSDSEPWVLLKAPADHCWINGNFQPQQYYMGRQTPAIPIFRDTPLQRAMNWTVEAFGNNTMRINCAASDLIYITATSVASAGLNRVFLTTAFGTGLQSRRHWTCKYPVTGVLQSRQCSWRSDTAVYRTVCIPVGAAAKLHRLGAPGYGTCSTSRR